MVWKKLAYFYNFSSLIPKLLYDSLHAISKEIKLLFSDFFRLYENIFIKKKCKYKMKNTFPLSIFFAMLTIVILIRYELFALPLWTICTCYLLKASCRRLKADLDEFLSEYTQTLMMQTFQHSISMRTPLKSQLVYYSLVLSVGLNACYVRTDYLPIPTFQESTAFAFLFCKNT